jgi:hypothetical protein
LQFNALKILPKQSNNGVEKQHFQASFGGISEVVFMQHMDKNRINISVGGPLFIAWRAMLSNLSVRRRGASQGRPVWFWELFV